MPVWEWEEVQAMLREGDALIRRKRQRPNESHVSASNPYLRDPEARKRDVLRSVASSSAIEGIRAPFKKGSSIADKSSSKRSRSVSC